MRFIATIDVDLDRSPLGTASRFGRELFGQTILARTIAQVARARQPAGVFVLCPAEQQARCEELIRGTEAAVRTYTVGPPPYRRLVRTARKWSLDGWRGGLGGAGVIDEYTHVVVLAALAQQESADAVIVIPGPAPLLDPALIDASVEHFRTVSDETRMTFMQTPPGLSPFLFHVELLAELAQHSVPPGWTMAYRPDRPEMDLIFRKCCCQVSRALRHAAGRVIADTDRAVEAIGQYLSSQPLTSAEHVGQWLIDRESKTVPRLPREVEIELTSEDPAITSGGVRLRPGAVGDGRRGPVDLAMIQRVAKELAAYDDSLVVLGGFGEPLAHPRFGPIVHALRAGGVYGIAVRTSGALLDDAAVTALTDNRVDVVSVRLDAWSAQAYRTIHGRELQPVLDALDRLTRAREQRKQVEPLIVPEMIKAVQTVDEMDAFFDGCLRKYGWATIVGYSTYAGAMPDYRVVDMSPPTRRACRRIRSRCMVLADGRVLACDQDCAVARAVGSLDEHSLADLWLGPTMGELRGHHEAGRFDADALCARCDDWHRP